MIIPSGPPENYPTSEDLLEWLGRQFLRYGDIFKTSIYGADAYASRDSDHAQHVLVNNWQNYVKGRLIKRVTLLLGNGLMTGEGEFWKRQRQMLQPAFHRNAVAAVSETIAAVN